jgi:hypothetical protein
MTARGCPLFFSLFLSRDTTGVRMGALSERGRDDIDLQQILTGTTETFPSLFVCLSHDTQNVHSLRFSDVRRREARGVTVSHYGTERCT